MLNNSIFVRKFCSVLSSFTTFIEIVCNTTLCYLISHLIITFKNSNSYLSLHSSSSFTFNFSIVIIIVEMLFIDFNIVYTIGFSIALLMLSCVFIELSFVCFSIIRRLSLMFVFEIVWALEAICCF